MTWIFGYGSLLWRPGFSFVEKKIGFVRHWTRRFYQGSPDHRGTPDAPGRVVTLLPEKDAICWGIAYRIHDEEWDEVLAYLDYREKGGFTRHNELFYTKVGNQESQALDVLIYVAVIGNDNYLGPAPNENIAKHIFHAHGPSGSNIEYLLRLAQGLREIEAEDPHVFELERLVCVM